MTLSFFAMSHAHLHMRGRRKLIAGSKHDGQNIHVIVDSAEYGGNCTNIELEIEKIGSNDINVAVGTINVNCAPAPLFTANSFTRVITDTGNNVLEMSAGTCTSEQDGDIVEVSCGLHFNDGSDLATARNHVHCSDNECGSLRKYTVKATVSGESASTSLPFDSACEAGDDYHSYIGRDDFCILDSCHRCADGYYCADTPEQLGECLHCADGYDTRDVDGNYTSSGASHCVACQFGYFQSGTDECAQCSDGSDTRDVDIAYKYVTDPQEHCEHVTTVEECAQAVLYLEGSGMITQDFADTPDSTSWPDFPLGCFRMGHAPNHPYWDTYLNNFYSNMVPLSKPDQHYDPQCGYLSYSRNATCVCRVQTSNYVTAAASHCTQCEFGKYQSGTAQCANCEDGSSTRTDGVFTTSGASHCVACETGKYQSGDVACQTCEPGRHTIQAMSPASSQIYVNTGATDCLICQTGEYQPSDGECQACPAGSSTREDSGNEVSTGLPVACVACELGKYSDESTTSCKQCADGYDTRDVNSTFVTSGATQCLACDIGRFQTGDTECANCADGSQTLNAGGMFTYSAATQCQTCASNYFQTGNSACMYCEPGYDTRNANDEFANTGATQCLACDTGQYQDSGSGQCQPCDPGSDTRDANNEFVYFGATACEPCEPGYYQSGNDQCAACPIGSEPQLDGEYSAEMATACVSCPAGKGNNNIGDSCEYIDCASESHKCRESALGTCGELGMVICDGTCVNKENVEQSSIQCPTLYGAFELYSDPDRAHELYNPAYCSYTATQAQQACVSWKGELIPTTTAGGTLTGGTVTSTAVATPVGTPVATPVGAATVGAGFDGSAQVSAIEQSSTLCTELKNSYDKNGVKAIAPTCQAYFNIVVPMYIYPLAWDGTANIIVPEWQTLIASATSNPHVKFAIIINPANGAGALYEQGLTTGENAFKWESWQQVVAPLQALSNVLLFGYVPTGYGADMGTSVLDLVQGWSTNWNIGHIFFDEVNGKVLDNGVYVDTLSTYSPYFANVSGTKICNFGSPQMADGTEYTTQWAGTCDLSVFAENEWSQVSAYQTPVIQDEHFVRANFAAIYHTIPSGFDFNQALDVLFAQQFGSVYFTDGAGDNPYIDFLDTWDTFVSHVSEWSLTAYTSRNSCASNPCQNGGTCSDVYNGYQCACVAGASGTNCETDIDECATTPCQNGGQCFDSTADSRIPLGVYACACANGWTGHSCDTDVNECSVGTQNYTPCEPNQACTDSTSSGSGIGIFDYACDGTLFSSTLQSQGYPNPSPGKCHAITYNIC